MSGTSVHLSSQEQAWINGDEGPAMSFAMRLVAAAAEVLGATSFVPIEMAHINSCHYSGTMSLDFAEFLLANGARFAVPTHTNASLISVSSPAFRPEHDEPDTIRGATRVMEIYESLGASTMWTCAPYQQPEGRPTLGQQVVGSESNAVGFVNTVLGARTNKYGDLLDVSAAMVGRVPHAGLHTDEGRRATHVVDVSGLPSRDLDDPNLFHLLGIALGQLLGSAVGAVVGIDHATEDDLKALTSAAAASGGVDLVHVVGVTPEAPTLEAATLNTEPSDRTLLGSDHLARARSLLTSANGDEVLRAVCLGTPHFSISEFEALLSALGDREVHPDVSMVVTTSRAVATELAVRGWHKQLEDRRVEIVLDTCSYYTPRPSTIDGLTMTNSAKWAYYSQGMLGVPVAFASLDVCVESAVAGRRR